jgi:hypothetical protein
VDGGWVRGEEKEGKKTSSLKRKKVSKPVKKKVKGKKK